MTACVLDAPCTHEWESETLDVLSCEGDFDIVLVNRWCRLCEAFEEAVEDTDVCHCKKKASE